MPGSVGMNGAISSTLSEAARRDEVTGAHELVPDGHRVGLAEPQDGETGVDAFDVFDVRAACRRATASAGRSEQVQRAAAAPGRIQERPGYYWSRRSHPRERPARRNEARFPGRLAGKEGVLSRRVRIVRARSEGPSCLQKQAVQEEGNQKATWHRRPDSHFWSTRPLDVRARLRFLSSPRIWGVSASHLLAPSKTALTKGCFCFLS